MVLDESARSTVIKKGLLKPGTEYSVYVRATTIKGDGSGSVPVVLKTPSKGMLKDFASLFVFFFVYTPSKCMLKDFVCFFLYLFV